MKARVKSWKQIKSSFIGNDYFGFSPIMLGFCGKTIYIFKDDDDGWYKSHGWYWHADWLEIIDEDAEIAEIYALLLIESGVIYE